MELPFGRRAPGRSAALRRDLKYVRHRLRELAEPGNTTLDVGATRRDMLRLLRDVGADDREAEEHVLQSLEASRTGFEQTLTELHDVGLVELKNLDLRMKPHRAVIKTLMDDELSRIELLETVIADLLQHAGQTEKPIRFTRWRWKPRERHR